MPDPDDLEAVRAEGRRLLDEARQGRLNPRSRFIDWMWGHADALLAPTLTEEERRDVAFARAQFAGLASSHGGQRLLAIIDRLSGSTSTGGPE